MDAVIAKIWPLDLYDPLLINNTLICDQYLSKLFMLILSW